MSTGLPGSRWLTRLAALSTICAVCSLAGTPSDAEPYRLARDTKVAVTIVQWNPSRGEYQRWDALGGTFLVSPEGTIGLPVIGPLKVNNRSSAEVAANIAAELKNKVGLLSTPQVTVEIVEYPPIYIVGAVTTPGSYQFRPDLTVLQALAVAGGRYRPSLERLGAQMVTIPGDLATIRADSLRLTGRIARLQAEMDGSGDIRFPPELTTDPDSKLTADVVALERTLFAARMAETSRQLTALAELREVYENEVKSLTEKSTTSNAEGELAQEELEAVEGLVDRGIVTVSRRSELRRIVTDIKARHLDEDVQILRARQGLSETTRQEFAIRDQRQTAVATELQTAQGDLARLRTRAEALRQVMLSGDFGAPAERPDGDSNLRFVIVRQNEGGSRELTASEVTPLLPGDVLKVEVAGEGESETIGVDNVVGSGDGPSDRRVDSLAAVEPVALQH